MCWRLFRRAGKRTRFFCFYDGLFPAILGSRTWDNHRQTDLLHRKNRRPDSELRQTSDRIWGKRAHPVKLPRRNCRSKKEAAGFCVFYEALFVRAAHEVPEAAGHAEHGVAAGLEFALAVEAASFFDGTFWVESFPGTP
jgi:hypothetical protein